MWCFLLSLEEGVYMVVMREWEDCHGWIPDSLPLKYNWKLVELSTCRLAGVRGLLSSESLPGVEAYGQCFQCACCTRGLNCIGAVSLAHNVFLVLFIMEDPHRCKQYLRSPLFAIGWLGEDKCKGVCLSFPPSCLQRLYMERLFLFEETVFHLYMYEFILGQRLSFHMNKIISIQTNEMESSSSQHHSFFLLSAKH